MQQFAGERMAARPLGNVWLPFISRGHHDVRRVDRAGCRLDGPGAVTPNDPPHRRFQAQVDLLIVGVMLEVRDKVQHQ